MKMRSFKTYGLIISILIFFSIVISAATPAEITPEAEKCLQKIEKKYDKAKTYQAKVTLSVNLAMGEREHESSLVTDLAWEKPNKISAISESDEGGVTQISNGDKYYKYLPALKEYKVEPAPDKIRGSAIMESGNLGQLGGVTDITAADSPRDVIQENLIKATLLKEEEIGDKTYCILLLEKEIRQNRVNMKLWMEKDTGALTKIEIDNQALLPAKDAPEKRIFTVAEKHENIKINEPVPEGTFEFDPPEGARKVLDFSFLKREKIERKSPENPMIGKPAPSFTLTDLSGKEHSLSDFRGKAVALDFWATWCAPCRKELPDLAEVAKNLESEGIVLLTINAESKEKVEKFLKDINISPTVLLDKDKTIMAKYNVQAIPMLFLIDRKGVIKDIHVGLLSQEKIKEAFGNLLKE